MTWVFFLLIAGAVGRAAWLEAQGTGGAMAAMTDAALKSAESGLPLALGLVGGLALFLGIMNVADKAGLVAAFARLLTPLLIRLFPQVPLTHPALGSISLNISANILGLGNAATPFGLRAMQELEELNPEKGRATDAQVLFLAINTASLTLLPTSVIALRAASGSSDPTAVVVPTLAATLFSTLVAVGLAIGLRRIFPAKAVSCVGGRPGRGWLGLVPAGLALVALMAVMVLWGQRIGPWLVPGLLVGILGYGLVRGVALYEAFVDGARQGFDIAIRILPNLIAILVAVGMFRQSGALDLVLAPLARITEAWGVPVPALALAGLRSLSGSGSFGMLASFMQDPAIGPDSRLGLLLGTIYGSSETTFYVIAVYFGAARITAMRHALLVGLLADLAGLVGAVCAVRWLAG